MKFIAIAILGLSMAASAQTAKVIQLSSEDAKQAKMLHDQQEAIAKKIADFDQAVRAKYLTAPKEDEGHTQTYSLNDKWIWVKSGWGSGSFQYSEDFRFIVPIPYTPSPSPYPCQSNLAILCGVTLTPAWSGSTTLTTVPAVGTFLTN